MNKTNFYFSHRVLFSLCIFILVTTSFWGQSMQKGGVQSLRDSTWGFGVFKLQLSYEEVSSLLEASSDFKYQKPSVSWSTASLSIISVKGSGRFIKMGHFQFYEKKLYSIILELNPLTLDYYTLFTRFNKRYGSYHTLSPQIVRWENERFLLALEKPLTVKYLDKQVHQIFLDKSHADITQNEKSQHEFLDQF